MTVGAPTVATTGKTGLGTSLKMGNGASPEVFSPIANVVSIDGPSETLETVDATHLLSPNFFREKLPHLKDGGQVTTTIQFDPNTATQSQTTGLKKKYDDRVLTHFQIDFSGAGVTGDNMVSFSAYVTNLGKAVAVDRIIEMAVTLTCSGEVVWGPAA